MKLLFSIHKATGTAIALFFLMWFVSGLVLLYHPYPRLPEALNNEKKETLPATLPPIGAIQERAGGEVKRLLLKQFQGQTLASVTTKDSTLLLNADPETPVKPITYATVSQVAGRWFDAPIVRVDTLTQREQWILYSKYDRLMPIYKFYFDDPEKHELFISGRTGEPQQLTTRSERFWAWIGTIPHKFYITPIRKDVDRWQNSIAWVSSICLIAALSGWILGGCLLVKRYRQKHVWQNPYKKRWHRWHFAFGMVFGLFLIGWGTSGIFSMKRIPQWMAPMERDYFFSASRFWGSKNPPLETYRLDYRRLKTFYPELKEVEWTHYGSIPVYRIIEGKNERLIDASNADEVKALLIPEETIATGVRNVHGDTVRMSVSRMDNYDNYYVRRLDLPLPVYKIEVDDADGTLYYVSPETGYVRYLTTNKKVRKWLFNGIHYLDIDWLRARPLLWTACIWTLCIGCGTVCLTGVVLSTKSLFRRKKKRIPTSLPHQED